MTSAANSREITSTVSTSQVFWPTLASGQPMPVMPFSISAILLGLHVIHGVLGNFQLPTFIQTLSKEKTNGEGDRLFTFPPHVIDVEDIARFTPRKRHLKPKKLLKRLGQDFDSFWMSVELPDDLLETHIKRKGEDASLVQEVQNLNFTSLELAFQTKYGVSNSTVHNGRSHIVNGTRRGDAKNKINNVVESAMMGGVLDLVQSWLVQTASCPVYYRWEDLGLLYWPRWVRRGMCSPQDTPLSKLSSNKSPPPAPSCSWPPGMHCVPAKAKRLRILFWTCRHNKALNNFNRFRQAKMPPLPGFPDKDSKDSESDSKERLKRSPTSSEAMKSLYSEVDATVQNILSVTNVIMSQHGLNNKNISPSQTVPNTGDKFENMDTKKGHGSDDLISNLEKQFYEDHKLLDGDRAQSSKISSEANSATARRRLMEVADGDDGDDDDDDDDDDNDDVNGTETWNRKSWKERRRKLNQKCKWIKIPYPVTDDCYCSC